MTVQITIITITLLLIYIVGSGYWFNFSAFYLLVKWITFCFFITKMPCKIGLQGIYILIFDILFKDYCFHPRAHISRFQKTTTRQTRNHEKLAPSTFNNRVADYTRYRSISDK